MERTEISRGSKWFLIYNLPARPNMSQVVINIDAKILEQFQTELMHDEPGLDPKIVEQFLTSYRGV